MSLSPDQSRFTACVIGEATPAEQTSFDAALLADPTLREEAVTLSRTAHRLATALQREITPTLTHSQRHRVLHPGAAQAAGPARKTSRPAWFGPTLATAGLAAALALTLYAWPARESAAPGSFPPTSIPSVAIQPGPAPKSGSRPMAPAPALAHESMVSPLPDAPGLTSPVQVEHQDAIAATPPDLKVGPLPVPPTREARRAHTPPSRPLPGQNTTPVESLASPRVLPP